MATGRRPGTAKIKNSTAYTMMCNRKPIELRTLAVVQFRAAFRLVRAQ